VSKAIDKHLGAERAVTRPAARPLAPGEVVSFDQRASGERERRDDPVTAAAVALQGLGTALKPAWEPIVLARKPLLIGTVAANVLEHGTGALNINGCRIGTAENLNGGAYSPERREKGGEWQSADRAGGKGSGFRPGAGEFEQPSGRWPANVVLDQDAAEQLDEQSETKMHGAGEREAIRQCAPSGQLWKLPGDGQRYGDSGGASRFFYCAKAGRREREAGLDHLTAQSSAERSGRKAGSAGLETNAAPGVEGGNPYAGATTNSARNIHPTVKPLSLMRWLVRLVTPPGALVLDPFAGSGTTGMACAQQGFGFIGMDTDAQYVQIANARIAWAEKNPAEPEGCGKKPPKAKPAKQPGLFDDQEAA
jgi:site-specific DNA-methyltransferase (adenine-specific)